MYTIPKKLLSPGATNAKTAKNNLKTFILYLAPYTQNEKGVNLCPNAGNCAAACLYYAGRGAFSNVQNARINKANYFVNDKPGFINQLAGELMKINSAAAKRGEKVAIRLNGTTDVDYIYLLKKFAKINPFELSNLIYYDYTKMITKVFRYKNEPGYFLTYSRDEKNAENIPAALKSGANVAVVFRDKLPAFYYGAPVVDGDKSDLVMLNNTGVIIGLRAKGPAKKDYSGFVVDLNQARRVDYLEPDAAQKLGRTVDELSPSEYAALKFERLHNYLMR